mmetsp:Transcript_83085/g.209428  ORF Transcript_83085/g.209428 Transcript_83085/m.209428 type:complete len:202 (-) Transcript_83085:251-856(-)
MGALSASSGCMKAMFMNFCKASPCFSTGIFIACHPAIQSLGFRALSQSRFSTSPSLASLRAPPVQTGSLLSSPMSAKMGSSPEGGGLEGGLAAGGAAGRGGCAGGCAGGCGGFGFCTAGGAAFPAAGGSFAMALALPLMAAAGAFAASPPPGVAALAPAGGCAPAPVVAFVIAGAVVLLGGTCTPSCWARSTTLFFSARRK